MKRKKTKSKIYGISEQVIQEGKFKIKLLCYGILGIICLTIFSLIIDEQGILKYFQLRKDKSTIEKEIRSLITENKNLQNEIKSLKNDPYYIEKYARERLRLGKKGEIIFKFDDMEK